MSLSIVFSTREINPGFIEHIRSTVGLRDAEIISYLNKGEFSLTELYNKGLEEAKHDVIVFMHDDVIFNNHNWGRALLKQFENTEYGILGIAGTTDLFMDNNEVNIQYWSVGRLKHQINGKLFDTFMSNRYEYPIQVVCLDGVFLAAHRNRIKQKFDIRFKGFHYYDISFTFSNHLSGVKVGVTFHVDLTHKSGGSYNQEWRQNRLLFLQIYKDSLPCRIRPDKIEYNPSLSKKFNPGNSLISIIIPAKDQAELVIDCIQSIIDRTRIARYEIIVAETEFTEEDKRTLSGWTRGLGRKANFSRIDILEYDYFNLAKIINDVVKNHLSKKSNYILFYDSRIKLTNDAIDRCLLLFRERKNVGTVGIRLHYGDNSIRHDGLKPLLGFNNIFDVIYQNLGSYYSYNRDTMEVFGNAIDFLMIDRFIFEKAYLNENYNELPDIELNLQMIRLGRKNYHIGHAVAYYYGNQTREENPEKIKKMMDDYHDHLLPFFKKHCVPLFFAQLFEGAARASQEGRHQTAVEIGELLLEHAPQHPDIHHLIGFIHGRQGDQTAAVKHIRQAIALNGQVPSYHYNLAEALVRQGEWKPAEQSYRRALSLDPRYADAYRRLAELLYNQGRLEEAVTCFQRALQLQPDDAEAHHRLGWALNAQGAYETAIACYQRALQLRPDFADAYNDLGVALNAANRLAEAEQAFRKAVEYSPGDAAAHRNLSLTLQLQGHIEAARDCFRQALALTPNDEELRVRVESLWPEIPRSNADIDVYRTRLLAQVAEWQADGGLNPTVSRLHLSTAVPPTSMIYQGRDDRPLKEAWAALFQGKLPEMPSPPASGKPHIGFVVTQNHEGVFCTAMGGILNRLNGKRFRLTVVCCQQRGEQLLRNAIYNPAIRYLPVPLRFDQRLEAIRQAGFHLLYHWEVGTDSVNYFLPFFRLAPVQCTSWGWPVTSGIPQMDYYLSCQYLERPDSDGDYSERLVKFQRLPACFDRPKPLPAPSERERFGLNASHHLYLCAQNLRKIQPDFDELLAGVLRRDPHGVAVLVEDNQPAVTAALRQRLQTRLPDVMAQVRFLPRLGYQDYHYLVAAADVALDTLYFGGGVTTYDTLGVGTPIVTLPTAFSRGRYAYAAYRQMGLDEGIAADPQDYVERALRFAFEPDYRVAFGARLREASTELFEDRAAVEEFEDFLEAAMAGGV